jgi:hypothetical protein
VDPGGEESFGQHRCRLLADGIIRAYERNARSLDERLAAVAERFAEDGVRLDRPYQADREHEEARDSGHSTERGSRPDAEVAL